ncbi:hypothetical protein EKO04_006063 [Ascochyta lentis]|uniref:Uncharacterized protein n=1 Tax=Ascochyta lentis TaxID=205686 RepID=A0A8H7J3N8_9PLEO|nr:hypothetical protein EKO04_006063 [Ascochyta lentis]
MSPFEKNHSPLQAEVDLLGPLEEERCQLQTEVNQLTLNLRSANNNMHRAVKDEIAGFLPTTEELESLKRLHSQKAAHWNSQDLTINATIHKLDKCLRNERKTHTVTISTLQMCTQEKTLAETTSTQLASQVKDLKTRNEELHARLQRYQITQARRETSQQGLIHMATMRLRRYRQALLRSSQEHLQQIATTNGLKTRNQELRQVIETLTLSLSGALHYNTSLTTLTIALNERLIRVSRARKGCRIKLEITKAKLGNAITIAKQFDRRYSNIKGTPSKLEQAEAEVRRLVREKENQDIRLRSSSCEIEKLKEEHANIYMSFQDMRKIRDTILNDLFLALEVQTPAFNTEPASQLSILTNMHINNIKDNTIATLNLCKACMTDMDALVKDMDEVQRTTPRQPTTRQDLMKWLLHHFMRSDRQRVRYEAPMFHGPHNFDSWVRDDMPGLNTIRAEQKLNSTPELVPATLRYT